MATRSSIIQALLLAFLIIIIVSAIPKQAILSEESEIHVVTRLNKSIIDAKPHNPNPVKENSSNPSQTDGTFESEFQKYVIRHNEKLGKNEKPRLVLARIADSGHGNRLPSMVCSLLYAMLTEDRIFMIEYRLFNEYHDFPFQVDYSQIAHKYSSASFTNIHDPGADDWKTSLHSNLDAAYSAIDVVVTHTWDYPCPTVYSNPHYKEKLKKMFPDGNMFHTISQTLFKWKPDIQNLVDQRQKELFLPGHFVIGVQIRSKKKVGPQGGVPVEHFCIVAKSLALNEKRPSMVFLAGDSNSVRAEFKNCAGELIVKEVPLDMNTPGLNGNPGNDRDGLIDMLLLSKTDHIIITFGSSFGFVAAGLGGIHSTYAMPAHDMGEPLSVNVWTAISTEPCMYKAKDIIRRNDQSDIEVFKQHPSYLHFLQCHP